MSDHQKTQETGEPTQWDIAWREGYTKALQLLLGVSYKQAYRMATAWWSPRPGWRLRLARWLLRQAALGQVDQP